MILHNVVQAIFMLTGIIALLASLFNWDWFFTADNAQFIVKKTGRNRARWIYGAIGVVFMAAALFFYFEIKTQACYSLPVYNLI